MRAPLSIAFVLFVFASEVIAQDGIGVGVSLDVEKIDGQRVPRVGQVFSAKFLCGTIDRGDAPQAPPAVARFLTPGTYLTAVNIHNPNISAMTFEKKALITNPQDEPRGKVSKSVTETLGPNEGLEIDCKNIIRDLLQLLDFSPSGPFFKGFVVITTNRIFPLDVVGVYTVKNVLTGFDLPLP